jgi:N-acetyl-alpha-D-muramate 1-phosphate uridylyltransferase
MRNKPDKAFLLAAGMGARLRPHTDDKAKPMVMVAGKSIIHRALAKLADAGVTSVVVNTHYMADKLATHLQQISAPDIILSHELELLNTGGGIKKMLQHFQDTPFYCLNGDALWEDSAETVFDRLAAAWDSDKMDLLLLLHPIEKVPGGSGDYDFDPLFGKAVRSPQKTGAYMFAGIRLVHPRLFNDSPDGAFSFLTLMDKAEKEGRLYAIIHDGEWFHISTPEDLARTEAILKQEGSVN